MNDYIVADLISPYLCIIDVVVFVGEVIADDGVDFFLNEGADVVEYSFFLFTHHLRLKNQYIDRLN